MTALSGCRLLVRRNFDRSVLRIIRKIDIFAYLPASPLYVTIFDRGKRDDSIRVGCLGSVFVGRSKEENRSRTFKNGKE